MGLFDQLESRCEEIAGKVGVPPDKVRSLGTSLQAELSQRGVGRMEALESVAREHGMPVDKVQEILSHCASQEDVESGLTGFMGRLFKH